MATYILRRVISAVPTLVLISVLVFLVIEITPGTYVDILVAQQIRDTGSPVLTPGQIQLLEKQYGVGQPIYVRWWKWFSRFVQGDMGRSYAYGHRPVAKLIGERIALTMLISFCSLAFSYLVALPIGIYSAVRQYTFGDHFFTLVSFLGLSVPNFLLALLFIIIGFFVFGQIPGGLFSPEYAEAPWSLAKVLDLLSRLWIPVFVLGTAGMAGTMRILRGNLLDQLRRPYVETARAKGLRETVLVIKYPVRLALNPFITSLGLALPGIVGGELIVSIVLNLPTTGPLLFDAVMNHDAFLAGAMVMLLSGVLVLGNLLSDLALAGMDPRIRYD
jgi:peptide/nickel transport system permease protein